MPSITRSYKVQSITAAPDAKLQVALVEDNSQTDVNGAFMGSSTVSFLMSHDEAKGFFPGDQITVTVAAT